MNIVDKEAIKILKRCRCTELNEYVESWDEAERDGMTDVEIVIHELDYIIEMFEEGGTIFSESLESAKGILKETHNGKQVRLMMPSLKPEFSKIDIDRAKNTVNEYKRLKRIRKEV